MTSQMSSHHQEGFGQKISSGCGCISAFFLGTLLLVLTAYFSLILLGAIMIVADPIEPVDAVVILSGDDGNRLVMAADMLDRGYVYRLVITNTNRPANRRLLREAEQAGFNRQNIFITDMQVDSTLDEARAVLQFARDQGWTALMVVTDPYHSFRTRLIFQLEFRGSGIDIYVRPVVGHWFRSSTWFYYPDGWRVVFLEISKMVGYLLLWY